MLRCDATQSVIIGAISSALGGWRLYHVTWC